MINFRKKIMKDGESSSKAARGRKTKETEHLISRCQNFAHLISRCENFAHPKTKVRNPWAKWSNFRTPQFQGAKSISRCEIRYQGANFLRSNFAHHCVRCENFRTVRNPLLAHVCQFRTPQANFCTMRNSMRKFRTPLFKVRKFRTPNSKVRNLQLKGCHFRTPNSKVRNLQTKVRKFRTIKF